MSGATDIVDQAVDQLLARPSVAASLAPLADTVVAAIEEASNTGYLTALIADIARQRGPVDLSVPWTDPFTRAGFAVRIAAEAGGEA